MDIASLIVSIVAVLVSTAALVLMLIIWGKQEGQLRESKSISKQISEKMLGTLLSVDRVYAKMVSLLEAAQREKSEVYVMLYWLWFGADIGFPESKAVTAIDNSASQVRALLWARVPQGLPTTIVTYGPDEAEDKLKRFYRALLSWHRGPSDPDELGAIDLKIDELHDRYSQDFWGLRDLVKDQADPRTHLATKGAEIPALMLAVDSAEPVAILFLLETAALEGHVESGGFVTHDPRMVDIIRKQITTAYESLAVDS